MSTLTSPKKVQTCSEWQRAFVASCWDPGNGFLAGEEDAIVTRALCSGRELSPEGLIPCVHRAPCTHWEGARRSSSPGTQDSDRGAPLLQGLVLPCPQRLPPAPGPAGLDSPTKKTRTKLASVREEPLLTMLTTKRKKG